MIFNTHDDIIELLRYNLSIRLDDYKQYQHRLSLHVINNNDYIITSPTYNVYESESYTEPDRHSKIMETINSLPNMSSLFELFHILEHPDFEILKNTLFSKGIYRLLSLCDLLYSGRLNTSNDWIHPHYKSVIGWDLLNREQKIRMTSMWIAYNQVFSDCNHRMALYVLEKYSSEESMGLADYVNELKTRTTHYCFESRGWSDCMNSLYKLA
jgi:hypothetical protein